MSKSDLKPGTPTVGRRPCSPTVGRRPCPQRVETADLDGLESLGEELQQEIDSDVYVLAFVALRLVCGDFAPLLCKKEEEKKRRESDT